MYSLNKLIGYLINPVALAWIGVLLALALRIVGRRRLAGALLVLCVAWTWLWATPYMTRMIGVPLEQPYLVDGCVPSVESYPQADVIELHGGAMGSSCELVVSGQRLVVSKDEQSASPTTNHYPLTTNEPKAYAEMWTSADRVWMAARLWRAQARKVKVGGEGEQWRPRLFVTGGGALESTLEILMDFGVPTNAMVFAESPRNTEEEARFIGGIVVSKGEVVSKDEQSTSLITNHQPLTTKPKVLVVTSAWHMRRTMMMYAKYAPNVEAIPAPCDFENSLSSSSSISLFDFIPNDEALMRNRINLHEWAGIIGYKYFRR